jgi:Flp pilus assembly protein CpaB
MNIENKKQIFTILLAVGLGLVATAMTSQYVEQKIRQETNQIAKDYEQRNAADREALVKEMEMRDRELSKKIAAIIKNQQQNQQPLQSAPKKVVVDSTLFSELTPSGKRAITILIDSLSAVGGLINPGDNIDIIAHLNMPNPLNMEQPTETVTSVLFQNVKVLAVGANFKPLGDALVYEAQQKSRSLNVTLALNPDEAALLTFAQRNGKLQMTLRSPEEDQTEQLQVASWESLSDYVLEEQGTELKVPDRRPAVQMNTNQQVENVISIYKGGRQL